MARHLGGWGLVLVALGGCVTPPPSTETTFGDPTVTPPMMGDDSGSEGSGSGGDGVGTGGGSADASGTGGGGLCGNGVIDDGEDCDDGMASATCNADCTPAACGDGVVNAAAGEACDDAGESATCDADCTAVACGDGVVNVSAGEACEQGGETATCDADCTAVECGDGVVNVIAGEVCDDGGESEACDADCTAVECGDGVANIAAGETCDELEETATCDADCTQAECGDGVVNVAAGEVCDDGGLVPGDGCGATCLTEFPNACEGGNDPLSGDPWVVCSADVDQAWVAHANAAGGHFHPELICSALGYDSVGQYGGTCGDTCSYCQDGTSCAANGTATFDGGSNCGMDGGGLVLCIWAHWQCVNP